MPGRNFENGVKYVLQPKMRRISKKIDDGAASQIAYPAHSLTLTLTLNVRGKGR